MRLTKGAYCKFKVKGFKKPIAGMYCAKGTEWVQLLHNTVDYVIDGTIFLNLDKSELQPNSKDDLFTGKVIKTRNIKLPAVAPLSTEALFKHLIKIKKLISIQLGKESVLYVGYVVDYDNEFLYLNSIDKKAGNMEECEYEIKLLTNITLKSDYLQALESYIKSKK